MKTDLKERVENKSTTEENCKSRYSYEETIKKSKQEKSIRDSKANRRSIFNENFTILQRSKQGDFKRNKNVNNYIERSTDIEKSETPPPDRKRGHKE